MSGVAGGVKVIGTKSVGYIGTNAIKGYGFARAIGTTTGKVNAVLTTSGVVNTGNAMNRE